jgi:hypothetical protein
VYTDWKPAFDAIFTAEEDTTAALAALKQLQKDAKQPKSPEKSTVSVAQLEIAQLAALETELMDSMAKLKTCKCIIGTAPTLEELLNPIQEHEVGNLPY